MDKKRAGGGIEMSGVEWRVSLVVCFEETIDDENLFGVCCLNAE